MDDSGILNMLRKFGVKCQADGGFYENANVTLPYEKRQIWPQVRISAQSESDYENKSHEKLEFKERLAHYRARVEHVFGRTCIGRLLVLRTGHITLIFYFTPLGVL